MRENMKTGVQAGSALIEALVAVLVFSFGILALVSMQSASIRSTADAIYRADASFLANQIIGQMWVAAPATLAAFSNGPSATAAGAEACPSGGAVSGEAAVASWLADVDRLLPEAVDSRQQITVVGDVVTVRVCWRDKSAGAGVYHNHVASAQINKNL